MAQPAAVRGAAYELACQRALQRMFGAVLGHSGGANDGGVDLAGWWAIQGAGRLRVLVQCKAEAKKAGPAYVRELEGTVVRAAWDRTVPGRAHDTAAMPVGVLASVSGFSRAALIHAQSSRAPLALIHLAGAGGPSEFDALRCHGIVWNDALGGANGLLRGRLAQRWPLQASAPTLLLDGLPIAVY